MLIQKAFAQSAPEAPLPAAAGAVTEVGPWGAVGSQFLLILVMVALFYVLLIMPQQRRFKEHKAMLDALKKGDKVITSGGLIGTIDSMEGDEIIVDLGGGTKVTALRHTISQKAEKPAPKNDNKKK